MYLEEDAPTSRYFNEFKNPENEFELVHVKEKTGTLTKLKQKFGTTKKKTRKNELLNPTPIKKSETVGTGRRKKRTSASDIFENPPKEEGTTQEKTQEKTTSPTDHV